MTDLIILNAATLAANMRNALVERKGATIGGGEFTPEELRDGAIALRAFPMLVWALEGVIRVADRATDEFDAARAALAAAKGE
jgi:hypothetical protein